MSNYVNMKFEHICKIEFIEIFCKIEIINIELCTCLIIGIKWSGYSIGYFKAPTHYALIT